MEKRRSKIIVNKFGGGILTSRYILVAKKRIEQQIEKGYSPIVVVSALNGVTDDLVEFFSELNNVNLRRRKENRNENRHIENLIDLFIKDIRKKHILMMRRVKISEEDQDKIMLSFDQVFQEMKDDFAASTRFGGLDMVQDKILSYGERLSALFFCVFLNVNDIKAKIFLAEDIPITTDNVHLNANINYNEASRNTRKTLKSMNAIPIINGFTGRDKDGNITTLGRGGTDTTACFVGAALKADRVVLWKDTKGVLSADPRIIQNAKTIAYLSYEEAVESGKIVHDKAISYVKDSKTPLEIVSISDTKKYTLVGPQSKEDVGAKIIGFKKELMLMVITDDRVSEYGFLFGVAKILSFHKINMVLIRNTRDSLHVVVENDNVNLEKALEELKRKKYLICCWPVCMITLIGSLNWKMVNIFNDVLLENCSNPQLGAFPYKHCVRLEAVVKSTEMKKVMRELHKKFIN